MSVSGLVESLSEEGETFLSKLEKAITGLMIDVSSIDRKRVKKIECLAASDWINIGVYQKNLRSGRVT